jgi:hypothetical protein
MNGKSLITLHAFLLISGSCSRYSREEQVVVDAYNGARKCILAGDYEGVKRTLSADRLKGIEDMMAKNKKTFSDIIDSIKQYVPSEVKITKITFMESAGVFLNLEGSRDGKTIQGNSFLKKEAGVWKVDTETWFWQGTK